MRPGNYVGFDLRTDGTAANRIVFSAEAGAAITTRNNRTDDGINLEGADYVTIEGFTINGIGRAGIRSVINTGVIIQNNSCDQNGRWGIFTGFSENILIQNNVTHAIREPSTGSISRTARTTPSFAGTRAGVTAAAAST